MQRIFQAALFALTAGTMMSAAGNAQAEMTCYKGGGGSLIRSIMICASSAEPSAGMLTYGPGNLYDFDNKTAWCEGVRGRGHGEEITMMINALEPFDALALNNGYQKTEKLYEQNGRPKVIEIITGDGDVIRKHLDDEPNQTIIQLPAMKRWKEITVRILDTYAGGKYDDTCISGLTPYFPDNM